ncbi:hypothetical protein BGS_0841 [Beggiatoa sp. SS]|nr:hypothetical protein BGS_0841 [Beggiatoa sp. SS]
MTVLNQTPFAFGQLINVDNQPDKLSLRLVIFGGEALDFTQLQPMVLTVMAMNTRN